MCFDGRLTLQLPWFLSAAEDAVCTLSAVTLDNTVFALSTPSVIGIFPSVPTKQKHGHIAPSFAYLPLPIICLRKMSHITAQICGHMTKSLLESNVLLKQDQRWKGGRIAAA